MNRRTETDEAGEFECPRCETRMVRYRFTKLWVHAECGRPGCFQVSYRRQRIWLTDYQLLLLEEMRHDEDKGGGRRTASLRVLHRKGFVDWIASRSVYVLNQEKCEEYRVFDSPKGADQ